MSIEEYRQEILSILLNVKNKKGELRFDEASAKELLRQLSDEELEEVHDDQFELDLFFFFSHTFCR